MLAPGALAWIVCALVLGYMCITSPALCLSVRNEVRLECESKQRRDECSPPGSIKPCRINKELYINGVHIFLQGFISIILSTIFTQIYAKELS